MYYSGVARQVAADDRLTSAAKSAAVKQPAAGFMEIIGFVKGIMGIYDSIVNPSTKELADLIKQGFSDVERELYDIQQSINDLISIIADQSMRTQYASTERVITESLRCYNAYLNMTQQEGKDYWRGEFLKTGSLLRESVSFLLDGMLGRNVFAGDIVATVTDAEKVGETMQAYPDTLHACFLLLFHFLFCLFSATRDMFKKGSTDSWA